MALHPLCSSLFCDQRRGRGCYCGRGKSQNGKSAHVWEHFLWREEADCLESAVVVCDWVCSIWLPRPITFHSDLWMVGATLIRVFFANYCVCNCAYNIVILCNMVVPNIFLSIVIVKKIVSFAISKKVTSTLKKCFSLRSLHNSAVVDHNFPCAWAEEYAKWPSAAAGGSNGGASRLINFLESALAPELELLRPDIYYFHFFL